MKRLVLISAVLALGVSVMPAGAKQAGNTGPGAAVNAAACRDDVDDAVSLSVPVGAQQATGLVALPSTPAKAIVAFAHGYGHTAFSWREHIARYAREEGVIAIAMNYRGDLVVPPAQPGGRPGSRGWQVVEGAEDSIAAVKHFEAMCPTAKTIVMYGVSMGGNTAGLAVAAAPKRADGKRPLFDFWINIEGAANLIETYHEARLVAQSGNAYAKNATEDIERQTGGTFEEVPDEYRKRTVVARISDIAASGIKGVILVHGLDDGLVPYNQSRELAAALHAARIPTQLHTVVTRGPGSEAGTTITGTVLGPTGKYDPPFAGHGSEASTTHTVTNTGFAQLTRLLREREVHCGEFLVDGSTATSASATVSC